MRRGLPKPPSALRGYQVNIRVSEPELEAAHRLADADGISIASMLRAWILNPPARTTLHEASQPATVLNVGSEEQVRDLEMRVVAMRRLGVTKWADIELGPDPTSASPDEDATQRSMTPEQEQEARRKRLQFAASGGPRPAVART